MPPPGRQLATGRKPVDPHCLAGDSCASDFHSTQCHASGKGMERSLIFLCPLEREVLTACSSQQMATCKHHRRGSLGPRQRLGPTTSVSVPLVFHTEGKCLTWKLWDADPWLSPSLGRQESLVNDFSRICVKGQGEMFSFCNQEEDLQFLSSFTQNFLTQ